MDPVRIILHATHLPPAGVTCQACFVGDVLQVDGPVSCQVPAKTLDVRAGGFNDDTLFLSWRDGEAHYSAAVADVATRRALLDAAPPALRLLLQRGHGELNYHRVKWHAVLGVLAAVLLAVGLAWWQSDVLTSWLASKVSLATEERLGKALLAQVRADNQLSQEGAAAEAVQAIGDRLTAGSRYTYQWYVADDDSVNAFAIPGGIVVVNSGLIAKTGAPEELAGVLAHEVQHVERRHTLQQMIHTAGWAAILAVALGDVSAISGVLIHQLGNLSKSRQLESEADAEGLKALARAGIPLDGLERFLRGLKAEEDKAGTGAGIALLSTHPATTERLASIAALAKLTPCPCQPLAYDWDAVRASLARAEKVPDT